MLARFVEISSSTEVVQHVHDRIRVVIADGANRIGRDQEDEAITLPGPGSIESLRHSDRG